MRKDKSHKADTPSKNAPESAGSESAGKGSAEQESAAGDSTQEKDTPKKDTPEKGRAGKGRAGKNASAQASEQDFQERYLLALAELRNISARHDKALGEARKRGAEPLAFDLLDSLDNLRRAVAAPECPQSLRGGLDLVLRGIEEAFARHGIVPFASLGEKLDPSRHEVMAELASGEASAGTVIQEVQTGWLIHGRLLRAARVVVAKALAEEKPADKP